MSTPYKNASPTHIHFHLHLQRLQPHPHLQYRQHVEANMNLSTSVYPPTTLTGVSRSMGPTLSKQTVSTSLVHSGRVISTKSWPSSVTSYTTQPTNQTNGFQEQSLARRCQTAFSVVRLKPNRGVMSATMSSAATQLPAPRLYKTRGAGSSGTPTTRSSLKLDM